MPSEAMSIRAPEIAGETFIDFSANIAAHAAASPDKTAILDDRRSVSWGDFGNLVARLAGRLADLGIGRGAMVASLAETSAAHIAAYCAVLSVGACMVPLPTSATQEALRGMRADCRARLIFTSLGQRERAEGLGAEILVDLGRLDAWLGDVAPMAPVPARPDDLFNMIYSSGTTGIPKGILHEHRLRSRQIGRLGGLGVDGDCVMMISTPLYSNTTLFGLLPVLAFGGTVVNLPKFDTRRFLAISQQARASHAVLVPVQYMRLMAEPDFDRYDLSSYRCKFATSSAFAGPLIAEVMRRWPGNLIEIYGMTEGGASSILDCRAHPDKWDTVGRPPPGSDMRIIDEAGREVPQGGSGEIVGRSGAMMRGYHNAPEKTAEIIWRDAEGNPFIRTGDVGRFDADGFLQLLDRKKDMIISGGFNIYAADLEAVLRGHPAVAEVAVIAVPSAEWGETPLGLVVPKPGAAAANGEEIMAWANARLGKTQRLSAVELRDELPRSEMGKILKRELRAAYWPPASPAAPI